MSTSLDAVKQQFSVFERCFGELEMLNCMF